MNNPEMSRSNEILLPAPMYYLKQGQIWQLPTDGKDVVQITNESEPIIEYDVSLKGDHLVYTNGVQLILSGKDGGGRKVIRQVQALETITNQTKTINDEDHMKFAIRSPLLSKDGLKVAFVDNGLWLMNLADEKMDLIWGNAPDYQEIIYQLLAISPDGTNFLVSTFSYPLQLVDQRTIKLVNKEKAITMPILGADGYDWYNIGQGLILSNSKTGYSGSLLRCAVADYRCVEIAEFEPGRWYYSYALPKVINDSYIQILMAAVSDPTLTPDSYKIIQVNLDGYNRQELFSSNFPAEIGLWSYDGSGIAIQLSKQFQTYPAGTVIWVDLNQKKIIELPLSNISQLKWGSVHEN